MENQGVEIEVNELLVKLLLNYKYYAVHMKWPPSYFNL